MACAVLKHPDMRGESRISSKKYVTDSDATLVLLPCCHVVAVQHFDLVEDKELAPLSELIEQFLAGKMNSLR